MPLQDGARKRFRASPLGHAGIMELHRNGVAFGRGINSIPVRFALMSLGLGAVCSGTLAYGLATHWTSFTSVGALVGAIAVMSVLPAIITYLAASRLTGSIVALQRSTEAIASGDVDQPVEVDCACEVGGSPRASARWWRVSTPTSCA